jgi:DNA-nicking Smr family endonuclease
VNTAPEQPFDVAQDGPFEEPVRLPIEDFLDLHAFAPKEIVSVIEEYLWQCRQAGIPEVRLIHGKGTGAQRGIIRRLLTNHPGVLSFADAPPQAGGWGATIVRLQITVEPNPSEHS